MSVRLRQQYEIFNALIFHALSKALVQVLLPGLRIEALPAICETG